MSQGPTRLGVPKWYKDISNASAVSNASTAVTAGVAVPDGFRHEISHLSATKTGTVTLKIYGYTNLTSSIGIWHHIDTVSFNETVDECVALRGIASFDRLQASVNAISAGNLNTYFGFCE